MKLIVRVFALSVVVAGVAAASMPSSARHSAPSSLAVSSALPIPTCGPGMPTCPAPGSTK